MKTHRLSFTLLVALFISLQLFGQTQEIRLFSHRGGRMENDENTLKAFKASYDAGYRGFETDIRMTKDGELVITHDSSLERTTNGKGVVEDHTKTEIMQLQTKQGNKMMFLDELLVFLQDKKGLYVEFEMKTSPVSLYPEDRLKEYCDKLYKKVMEKRPSDALYVFTSSDYRALRYLQSHYPGVDLLLITSKPCNAETIALCRTVGINRLGATMNGTSRESVQKAHKEGIIVSLWPGKSVEDFMLGAYLGCDYMCTDIPIQLKKWIAAKAPWINVKY
ncbi:glycerophosphoryl diester phosphodiesterase [Bacteroides faecichinchillae]|uniref:Glycerophosphoryl diester phosphodiesterase n=1 Tax=Bacteroides faecichinchillae TaxID=871325 RepID=A0A1M4TCQ0_9BACE|nr:glycerophosphodiester phosphodiesterase [Bacteroides faecichinchillae]THG56107.1 glycerophosphodiester phosphodiesterase [Bacteroides faecichinchillae]SHE42213.1 glycerophosphoryl diester phosphodiesterase [Bacteroides faecichinchillae]